MSSGFERSIRILLVEDNPDDVELTVEALRDARIRNDLQVAGNGEDALAYLRGANGSAGSGPRPDLVLLDLNLPGLSGREVLARMKADAGLRSIPVVVLTTSGAEEDIATAYDLHANCYITKPVDFNQVVRVVRTLEDFWFDVVRLPPEGAAPRSS